MIFVSEKKRGIKRKYFEIIKNFGLKNFIKSVIYEFLFYILLHKRKAKIKAFYVSDYNLNPLLEKLIIKNKYKIIISIGCPCFINKSFKNYKLPILNIHGGIIPFQKGRYSPLKSIKKGHRFLGSTIHVINDDFDSGEILSQDYFELKNKDKLYNYNKVLTLSSDLLNDFIVNKNREIPDRILRYFEKS